MKEFDSFEKKEEMKECKSKRQKQNDKVIKRLQNFESLKFDRSIKKLELNKMVIEY